MSTPLFLSEGKSFVVLGIPKQRIKEYPLHHNHTHPTKFSSEFRKLHVRDYSIVLKSDKNKVPCYLKVAFLPSELHLYLHILIYMFNPCKLFFGMNQVGTQFLN